jgi:hypothetical protein
MFAPKVAKPHAAPAKSPIGKLTPQHSTLVARAFRGGAVEQAHMLQRGIGNQATPRLLAQQVSRSAGNEPSGDHEQEVAPENRTAPTAPRGVSWDFSKISLSSLDRPNGRRAGLPLTAPLPLGMLQPKLVVGAVDDPLEHEADRVADQVIRMPGSPPGISAAAVQVSRKCAACEEKEHTVLQAKREGSAGVSGDIPSVVHDVLRSPGQPLDSASLTFFEPRFQYDFSGVRVHADTKAAASAQAVGALAYAVGRHVVFDTDRYAPLTAAGRTLLAHELTHVVQQPHADSGEHATIRRYTKFDSAAQLAKTSLGWVHPGGSPLRVSEDGKMATEDNGWGEDLSKRAWTTPTNLATSNAKLAAAGSNAKLVAKGNPISGAPPANSTVAAITLQEVEPVKVVGTGSLELASDCGSACKEVMGSSASGKDVSVMKSGNSETYGSPKAYHGGDPTTPEEWTEELYKKEFGAGLSRLDAYKKYAALSPADKDKLDRKYGRNKYARPEVGQGITISTEKDAPGSHDVSSFTWNFHYAAAVMSSGVDYVTLENAAGWKKTGWIFFMYGPASKAQTFLEEQAATLTHGSDPSAAVVEPEKVLNVVTIDANAPLLVGKNLVHLAKGTALRVMAKNVIGGQTWLTVEVKSGPKTGTQGKIRGELVK